MEEQNLFDDLLTGLTHRRQVHSRAVGRKAASFAMLVRAHLRADLVIAGTLHDIGYGHTATGFHPIDGARFLADQGFSEVVCHLVAHHSASSLEAEERGIDVEIFREFGISSDSPKSAGIGRAHAVLWWADLTTSPDGEDVDVKDRLNEICGRYGPNDPVTRFVDRARDMLIAAGHLPIGSIQVPVSSIAH
ncbi:MAG TPA: HD domain-containing protein [Mycobacterium sp.]